MSNKPGTYYVPAQSSWPIIGAFALFLVAVGAGMTVQGTQSEGAVGTIGSIVLAVGFLFLLYMLAGWFSNVITESLSGKYSSQITRSFRQGMSWFIFSEVMFFGAFFGGFRQTSLGKCDGDGLFLGGDYGAFFTARVEGAFAELAHYLGDLFLGFGGFFGHGTSSCYHTR